MKIVLNKCYGGFSLSREAVLLGRAFSNNPNWGGPCIKGDSYKDGEIVPFDYGYIKDIERDDPILVQVVEYLGSKKSSGSCAKLEVEDIPKGTLYRIEEHDGWERIECYYDVSWKVAD
jgi:hypothetical protein